MLSGLADIPIAFTFLSIGLLLWVYYQAHPDPTLPKTANETFCHFILYQMPVGLRGLLIAGIFATAMGSLSTALNALATSFTRDWYLAYIKPAASGRESLRAVRWATVGFAILMIIVASATSYCVIVLPNVRIIPIALGIFGYTYGSLLGIFFAGMLTKTRGNDFTNPIAMISGFLLVSIVSNLPNDLARLLRVNSLSRHRLETRYRDRGDVPFLGGSKDGRCQGVLAALLESCGCGENVLFGVAGCSATHFFSQIPREIAPVPVLQLRALPIFAGECPTAEG